MLKTLKFQATQELVDDLEELKELLGASTAAEAIRRAVASEVIIRRQVREGKVVKLIGKRNDSKKDEVYVYLA
jgi:hypothetical protein